MLEFTIICFELREGAGHILAQSNQAMEVLDLIEAVCGCFGLQNLFLRFPVNQKLLVGIPLKNQLIFGMIYFFCFSFAFRHFCVF